MSRIFIFALLLSGLFLFACNSNKQKEKKSETTVEEKNEVKPAVCIYDGISLREKPVKGSKYITAISLGESFTYLGKSAVDSTDENREYLFIELSDGTKGWAFAWGIVIDGKIAATIKDAKIYSRPDLLNKTDKLIEAMDIVAVDDEKDEWFSVVGNRRKISGWVKKDELTFNEEDIVTASLIQKELYDKKGNLKMDMLKEFIANAPYPDNRFIAALQVMLDEQNKPDEVKTENADESEIDTNLNDTTI